MKRAILILIGVCVLGWIVWEGVFVDDGNVKTRLPYPRSLAGGVTAIIEFFGAMIGLFVWYAMWLVPLFYLLAALFTHMKGIKK